MSFADPAMAIKSHRSSDDIHQQTLRAAHAPTPPTPKSPISYSNSWSLWARNLFIFLPFSYHQGKRPRYLGFVRRNFGSIALWCSGGLILKLEKSRTNTLMHSTIVVHK